MQTRQNLVATLIRSFSLLLALWLIVATVLPAQAADEETISIRSQGVEGASNMTVRAIAQRAVLKAFQEKYPNIEVEPFFMPAVGSAASMDTGPLMAIAAGIPPHAIYVNFRQSSTYLSQGFLEPIEILLARILSDNELVRQTDDNDQWLAEPTEAEIAEALELIRQRVPGPAWEVVYREDESGRYPGKHAWAIPDDALVMALLYRKDLYREAGLDPEQPPQTWDEYLEYARLLTVPEKRQYGTLIHGGPNISWSIYTFLVSNGARAVAPAEDGRSWKAVYGTRDAAEALHFVWRLAHEPFERDGRTIKGAAIIGTNGLSTMWEQGRIGMQFSYLSDQVIDKANPQLIGIAPVPMSPKGTRGSEFNSRMLGVFAGCTPEQKLAVMRYLWFRTGKEAKKISTQIFVDGGFGLFVNPKLLEEFGYDRLLQRVPDEWKEVFNTAMAAGVPEPFGKNTQNIYLYMSQPVETVLRWENLHEQPTEQVLDQIESELVASMEKTNVDMLGNIPPDEMRKRRIIATIVIILIGIAFVWGFIAIWRYFGAVATRSTEGGSSVRRAIFGYTLLIPALAITIGWMYFPLGWGFILAFTDYRLIIDNVFVGVDNFAIVLFDASFWWSLARTFYFVSLAIGLGFWPPILLAILLDEVPTATLKYIYRTIFYLPAIISGVIIMFLWRQLYDPSEYGALNTLLMSFNALGPVVATVLKWVLAAVWLSFVGTMLWLPIKMDEMSGVLKLIIGGIGLALVAATIYPFFADKLQVVNLVGKFQIEALDWVASPELAMLCVVIPMVWAGAGPGCLLYLAALKTIPSDLYEAADLDGAGPWHKVCYITLPRLKYLIGIQFIAAVIGAFKGGTDYILAMTGGGPNGSTTILALHIFMRTFMELQFGIGTAMAWLLGALLVGFTAYQLKMLSKAEFKASGAS